MGYEEHKTSAGKPSIRCAVVTVSDSRTPETDKSGSIIKDKLIFAGHAISYYNIVPDEPPQIESEIISASKDSQVVIFTGGTGISARDSTFEVISGTLEKTLPEIFSL